jgi:hypothetical protein
MGFPLNLPDEKENSTPYQRMTTRYSCLLESFCRETHLMMEQREICLLTKQQKAYPMNKQLRRFLSVSMVDERFDEGLRNSALVLPIAHVDVVEYDRKPPCSPL